MSTAASSTNATALLVSIQGGNGGYGPLYTYEVKTDWLVKHLTASGEQHVEAFLNNYTASDAESIYKAALRAAALTKDLTPRVAPIAKDAAIYVRGVKYVPERTCRDISDSPYTFICSECGCKADAIDDDFESTVQVNGIASTFHCCPNCCAKVVD